MLILAWGSKNSFVLIICTVGGGVERNNMFSGHSLSFTAIVDQEVGSVGFKVLDYITSGHRCQLIEKLLYSGEVEFGEKESCNAGDMWRCHRCA